MNKPLCVISSPVDIYSGYGARSRDLIKSIIKLKEQEWDIKLISMPWGNCPWNYLKDHNENDLQSRIITQLTQQPEVWIQISIPNEFQPVGKYNIGVTAGIETTICDVSWIEGLNRMNLNLVSSEHAKKVFMDSKFERKNQQGQTVEIVELKSKVEVLFEGVYLNIFKHDSNYLSDLSDLLSDINENYCFLFLGSWLQGDLGQDRKDIGMLVKVFLETFKNTQNQPALILKTGGAMASILDKEEILSKIDVIRKSVKGKLPNIYLLHGEFSDEQINELYNHPKVKAFVSFTKGEGFGRPLLEFTTSKKPVIAPNWSGQIDFLNKDFVKLLPGKITQIHPSAVVPNMLLKESGWFTVDYVQAGFALREMVEKYDFWKNLANRQAFYTKQNFSMDKMTEKLDEYLKQVSFPKPVQIVLPSFNKLKLPKLSKIESQTK